MKISPKFKKIAAGSLAGLIGLAYTFHISAHKHMDETSRVYSDPMPRHVATVTGGAQRVAFGLQKLAAGEIEKLHISGASSPKDSILFYNNHHPEHFAFCDQISLDDAKNTRENAANIIKWALNNDISEVGVVTSRSHMGRLLRHLEKQAKGTGLKFSPHTVGNEHAPRHKTVYREYVAQKFAGLQDAFLNYD